MWARLVPDVGHLLTLHANQVRRWATGARKLIVVSVQSAIQSAAHFCGVHGIQNCGPIEERVAPHSALATQSGVQQPCTLEVCDWALQGQLL